MNFSLLDDISGLLNFSLIGEKLLRIGFVLALACLAKQILVNILQKSFTGINHGLGKDVKEERIKTLSSVLTNLISFAVGITTILIILSELGVDIAPLIAGIGILGLGVGFASQTLVKDYISGFFILFEGQFNVGDEVEIGGKKGTVEELSLRSTILKDKEGNTHIIPNSKITTVTRYRGK